MKRALAYLMSLVVLGAAAWQPTAVFSQSLPGNALSPGSSSGGVSFPLLAPAGTAGAPSYSFQSDATTGIFSRGTNTVDVTLGGTARVEFHDSLGIIIASAEQIGHTTTIGNAPDIGIERLAAGVYGTTNGSTGLGWLQVEAGRSALAADYTNATAVVSNLTGLTINVLAARKYTFNMDLFFSNSTAADGIRVDFNGGTAAATDFRVHCLVFDTALLLSQQATALDTDIVATTTTGASLMRCSGSFEPSGAGTFIARAAEEADGGGTLTITRGSHLWIEDVPFN